MTNEISTDAARRSPCLAASLKEDYMKKSLSRLIFFLSAFIVSGLAVSSCVEEMPEVIEDLNLPNVLTPGSTSAVVSTSDGRTVTFTWTNSNAATEYLLQIYQFSADKEIQPALGEITEEMLSGMVPEEVTVTPAESGTSTSASLELEREFSYYARVRAQNPELNPSKWAVFPYPIDTYSVMDPVEAVNLVERTSNSITVSWMLAADDTDGITEIRVSPNPDDSEEAYKTYPVEAGATECVVDGLKPSTRYTVALHYKSANRGEVKAWTRPDTEGATTVKTADELEQALLEAADFPTPPLKIVVAYNDGFLVSDTGNHVLRYLDMDKEWVYTAAGTGKAGFRNNTGEKAAFDSPTGLAVDNQGTVYIADTGNNVIRCMDEDGKVTTYAGGEEGCALGNLETVQFSGPTGLCWADGVLYVADTGNHRIVAIADGEAALVAGAELPGEAAYEGGYLNGPAELARFASPQGVAVGADGTVYVADTGNGAVRAIREGYVTTLLSPESAWSWECSVYG